MCVENVSIYVPPGEGSTIETKGSILCYYLYVLLKNAIKKYNLNITNKKINFRDDNGYILSLTEDKDEVLYVKGQDSDYCVAFLSGNILRENCYNCKYANEKRISDITIGDFWGLSNESKLKETEKSGISAVLINTEKGEKIFNNIKEELIYEERDVLEAINGNTQLRHPVKRTKKRDVFEKKFLQKGYEKAMRSIEPIKNKLKRIKIVRSIYYWLKKGGKNG